MHGRLCCICILATACRSGAEQPALRLEGNGFDVGAPNVQFTADGTTLFATHGGRMISSWVFDEQSKYWRPSIETYIAGNAAAGSGGLSELAMSSDGRWLAAVAASSRIPDQGLIYVFDRRRVEPVREYACAGVVLALAFAPEYHNKPSLLCSILRPARGPTAPGRPTSSRPQILLWSFAKSQPTAQSLFPEDAALTSRSRPSLSVWRVDADPKQGEEADERLAVAAVAWNDGKLRFWKAAVADPRAAWLAFADGESNNALAVGSGGGFGRLLTASVKTVVGGKRFGQIQTWDLLKKTLNPETNKVFRVPGVEARIPQALTIVSQQPLIAGLVLQDANRNHFLSLMRLDEKNPNVSPATLVPLRLERGGQVHLAASGDGRHVAVSVERKQQTLIYSVDAILNGTPSVKPQLLRPGESLFRSVTFAVKNDSLGLMLGKGNSLDEDESVSLFDVQGRALTEGALTKELAGWRPIRGAPEDEQRFRKVSTPGGPLRLKRTEVQFEFKGRRQAIDVGAAELTAAAFHLVGKSKVPVVALSVMEEAQQPQLWLYHAGTGEPLQSLSGPTAPIRGLAFTADGELLAATSDDRTTSVWSLKDLDQLKGARLSRRGRPGLYVTAVDSAGLLHVNELLVAPWPMKSPLLTEYALLRAIKRVPPNGKIVLHFKRENGRLADVKLPVAEFVEERKPLWTLFVGAERRQEWIAWTPQFWYDSGDNEVERWFRWPIPPALPGEPVSYVNVLNYVRRHREAPKKGLLQYLTKNGEAAAGLEEWTRREDRPADPKLSLAVEAGAANGPNNDGALVVRSLPLTLRLRMENPDFALDRIESIGWDFDGDAGALTEGQSDETGRTHVASLNQKFLLKRGPHQVQTTLRTNGVMGRSFRQSLRLYYQPPAPRIRFPEEWRHLQTVTKETAAELRIRVSTPERVWILAADVEPGRRGEPVAVRLVEEGKAPRAVPDHVREPLTLAPGDNRFLLEAVNAEAPKGSEGLERSRRLLVVEYAPPEIQAPPTIELTTISSTDGRDVEPIPLDRKLETKRSLVRIHGRVSALKELEAVRLGDRVVAGFTAGTTNSIDLDEEIRLAPGEPTKITLTAVAQNKESRAEVMLTFVPELPSLVFDDASAPREVINSGEPAKVKLVARVVQAKELFPFIVALRRNGDLMPAVAGRFDQAGATWTADAPLVPHKNAFHFEISNVWGRRASTPEIQVAWLRRPRIVRVLEPKVGALPFADLEAVVFAPAEPMKLTVVVNGAAYSDAVVSASAEKTPEGIQAYRLKIAQVPLMEGINKLSIRVGNEDGSSPESESTTTVDFKRPALPKAVIIWEDPPRDGVVASASQNVLVRIQSTSPLQKVSLELNKEPLQIKLTSKNENGAFSAKVEAAIQLKPGKSNVLTARVVNSGGESHGTHILTCTPVRILFERLQSNRAPVTSVTGPAGEAVFGVAEVADVVLVGKAVWSDAGDPSLTAPLVVRVWLNKMQQLPIQLEPAKGLERAFRITTRLNRRFHNRIEIEFVGKQIESQSPRAACEIEECREPKEHQILFVLMIGLGNVEGDAMKSEVIRTLGATAKPDQPNHYTAEPRFKEVILLPPVAGDDADRATVFARQVRLRKMLQEAAQAEDGTSNAVLLYYRGPEKYGDRGCYLLTNGPEENPNSKILLRDFEEFFMNIPGAPALFLDVPGAAAEPPNESTARTPTVGSAETEKRPPIEKIKQAN